jgi:hypothetical protein
MPISEVETKISYIREFSESSPAYTLDSNSWDKLEKWDKGHL